MSFIFISIASILAASVNFCLRKNMDKQESAAGYLSLYFMSSFIISFCVIEFSFDSFRFVMPSIGAFAGLLNFLMMILLARCLQIGASGLTFAFQNSASMFPSLLLFFIFGSAFGFNMNMFILIGFALIVGGLFLSSLKTKNDSSSTKNSNFGKWFVLVIAIFFIQGLILSLFQWRCLLLSEHADHLFIPWKCAAKEDSLFMPGFFLTPAILQTVIFVISERRWFSLRESFLGISAGLLNGAATFFLLMATKQAEGEKAILFPLFAVTVIFLCSLWGKFFYKERIYWPGILLCLAGVFIGSFFSY